MMGGGGARGGKIPSPRAEKSNGVQVSNNIQEQNHKVTYLSKGLFNPAG
jgi:hypothetical protein